MLGYFTCQEETLGCIEINHDLLIGQNFVCGFTLSTAFLSPCEKYYWHLSIKVCLMDLPKHNMEN